MLTILFGVLAGGLTGYTVSSYLNRRNVYACIFLCNKRVSVVYFALLGALLASGI